MQESMNLYPLPRDKAFAEPLIKELVEERKRQGLTQSDLDEKIGLTQGQLAKWETGDRSPTLWNAYCWASALGVELTIRKKDEKKQI